MLTFKRFLIAMVGPVIFGLIDNGGLFVGMSVIEDYLKTFGYNSLVAAGMGNAFSDALGVITGGSVSMFLYSKLKLERIYNYWAEVVGIIVGCMIPVFIAMAC
jgi:hypothetical protein